MMTAEARKAWVWSLPRDEREGIAEVRKMLLDALDWYEQTAEAEPAILRALSALGEVLR